MDETRTVRGNVFALLRTLSLGLAIGACQDPEIVEPVTDPDSTAARTDSTVASVEMLPAERSLSFIGMTYRMGARRIAVDGTLNGGSTATVSVNVKCVAN